MEGPQVDALSFRLAALAGRQWVDRIDVPAHRWQANVLLKHCAGKRINQIYSHGRWLFWNFSHGVSWAIYPLKRSSFSAQWVDDHQPAAAAWSGQIAPLTADAGRRPLMRITLENGGCLTLSGRPLLLVLPTENLYRHASLANLGPKLTDEFLTDVVWEKRLRQVAGEKTISQAIMDESVVAGIGNAIKCEMLFAGGIHPAARTGSITGTQMVAMLAAARRWGEALCRAALDGHATRNLPWRVYDRAGEPCDQCAVPILAERCGRDGLWSWFCTQCQSLPRQPTLFGVEPPVPAVKQTDSGRVLGI
jgi:formamidopyrimidine-DNA glycosylase